MTRVWNNKDLIDSIQRFFSLRDLANSRRISKNFANIDCVDTTAVLTMNTPIQVNRYLPYKIAGIDLKNGYDAPLQNLLRVCIVSEIINHNKNHLKVLNLEQLGDVLYKVDLLPSLKIIESCDLAPIEDPTGEIMRKFPNLETFVNYGRATNSVTGDETILIDFQNNPKLKNIQLEQRVQFRNGNLVSLRYIQARVGDLGSNSYMETLYNAEHVEFRDWNDYEYDDGKMVKRFPELFFSEYSPREISLDFDNYDHDAHISFYPAERKIVLTISDPDYDIKEYDDQDPEEELGDELGHCIYRLGHFASALLKKNPRITIDYKTTESQKEHIIQNIL